MKQLLLRFDNGFQKLQSHLETHYSDHLGHLDPLKPPHIENTAILQTSAKGKRQSWKGEEAKHSEHYPSLEESISQQSLDC